MRGAVRRVSFEVDEVAGSIADRSRRPRRSTVLGSQPPSCASRYNQRMGEYFERPSASRSSPGRGLLTPRAGLIVLLLAASALTPAFRGEGHAVRLAELGPGIGTFLVARNNLPDPNFFETVVLLLAYDEREGAAGVVVNRRTDISVGEAVAGLGLFAGRQDSLYLGGPVAVETIVVLLRGAEPPMGSSRIVGDLFLVHDADGLEALMRADPAAASVRFYAGYAGWSPGQLEGEISRGVWHLMAGDAGRVFSDSPEDAWADLIRIVFGPRA